MEGEVRSTEVVRETVVRSPLTGLDIETALSTEVVGGLGGGVGGTRLATSSSVHCSKRSMILGSFCIFLANGRAIFNKVIILFLCFKQNQTISVISVSIKAPEMI